MYFNPFNKKIQLRFYLFCLLTVLTLSSNSQSYKIKSGPFLGYGDEQVDNFWLLVKNRIPKNNTIDTAELSFLIQKEMNTGLQEMIVIDSIHTLKNNEYIIKGHFNVSERASVDSTFSFLIGSCAFPYPFAFWSGLKKEKIFKNMTNESSDLMVWMGDNTYYLFGEWKSKGKMINKQLFMRNKKCINELLKSSRQLAIWDDHDYGPNNSDGKFEYKTSSLEVFNMFWPNKLRKPEATKGVFFSYNHGPIEFLLLDARYHTTDSSILGWEQTQWLYHKLKTSNSKLKFIVSPTQVLPDNPEGEDFGDYGSCRDELLRFIDSNDIKGVVFLSGDRHYGELMKLDRGQKYPLYEITSSPMTSIVNIVYTANNQYRIEHTLVMDQNYVKIEVLDLKDNIAKLVVAMKGKNGEIFWEKILELSF